MGKGGSHGGGEGVREGAMEEVTGEGGGTMEEVKKGKDKIKTDPERRGLWQ